MRQFVTVLFLIGVVRCVPVKEDTVLSDVVNTFSSCTDGNYQLCLKEKALSLTERMNSAKSLDIFDGLSIINVEPSRISRSLEPLSNEPEAREVQIEDRLLENVADFLDSRAVQLRMPKFLSEARGQGHDKKKKLRQLMPLIMLLKLKLQALIPLFLAIIAFVAVKFLLLKKLVFLVGAIALLKKLLSHYHEEHGWHSAPVHQSHGGWSNDWSGSQGWGRSGAMDAQDLAYSGYVGN